MWQFYHEHWKLWLRGFKSFFIFQQFSKHTTVFHLFHDPIFMPRWFPFHIKWFGDIFFPCSCICVLSLASQSWVYVLAYVIHLYIYEFYILNALCCLLLNCRVRNSLIFFLIFIMIFSYYHRVEQSKFVLKLHLLMLPAKSILIIRQPIIQNILSSRRMTNNNMNTLKLPSLLTTILGWTPMK